MLQPSNTMYPSTPATVMTPRARSALSIRRSASRGSYTVPSEADLLLDPLRSTIAGIIVGRPALLRLEAIRLTRARSPPAHPPLPHGAARRCGAAGGACRWGYRG